MSDHLVWGADLDKGELGIFGNLSCQRRFPTARWAWGRSRFTPWLSIKSLGVYSLIICLVVCLSPTFKENRHQGCAVTVLCLLYQQLTVFQDGRHWVAPPDYTVHDVTGVVLLVGSKCLKKRNIWNCFMSVCMKSSENIVCKCAVAMSIVVIHHWQECFLNQIKIVFLYIQDVFTNTLRLNWDKQV